MIYSMYTISWYKFIHIYKHAAITLRFTFDLGDRWPHTTNNQNSEKNISDHCVGLAINKTTIYRLGLTCRDETLCQGMRHATAAEEPDFEHCWHATVRSAEMCYDQHADAQLMIDNQWSTLIIGPNNSLAALEMFHSISTNNSK